MTRHIAAYERDLAALVGRNVHEIRQARELSQDALCALWRRHGLDWARSKLSALENGHRPKISLGELKLMARAFDMPVVGLLDDGDRPIEETDPR